MLEQLGIDSAGRCDFSLPAPVSCYDVNLDADTPITIPTPANYNRAFFAYAVGTNVWVTLDGSTPIVPSSGAVSTQELNPSVRQINYDGSTVMQVISDTASFINIRFDANK